MFLLDYGRKESNRKKVAVKKTATKTTATKTTAKRCATKKAEVVLNVNAESVGFRAGDVYQALAAAEGFEHSGNRKGC